MTMNNQPSKNRKPVAQDAIKTYTDSTGVHWILSAEFKIFNQRPDIASLTISPKDLRSPITRRLLSELPLDKLFRNELAIETEQLARMLRNRKGTTAHQGRQHSDEDLQAVADIYLAAHRARIPVQKAVADALGISVSTAAKRIMASRQQGFITSTTGDDYE